jgi:hypothetical protein
LATIISTAGDQHGGPQPRRVSISPGVAQTPNLLICAVQLDCRMEQTTLLARPGSTAGHGAAGGSDGRSAFIRPGNADVATGQGRCVGPTGQSFRTVAFLRWPVQSVPPGHGPVVARRVPCSLAENRGIQDAALISFLEKKCACWFCFHTRLFVPVPYWHKCFPCPV